MKRLVTYVVNSVWLWLNPYTSEVNELTAHTSNIEEAVKEIAMRFEK